MTLPHVVLFIALVLLIGSATGAVTKLNHKGQLALGVAGLFFFGLIVYQQLALLGVL